MNLFAKSLTLLLAGLLTAASLLSCASTSDPAAQSDRTTTAATTTSAPVITDAPSVCLSPAQLMRKMKDADEMTFHHVFVYEVYGKEYQFIKTTCLKNDKVMTTVINLDPYGNRSEVKTYYDLKNGLHYAKNENGKWIAEPTDATWEAIVNGFGLSELLDSSAMKKKGDHYEFPAAKAKEWRDQHGFDGDVSVKLVEKDGVHTVSVAFTNNSNGDDQSESYAIEFKSSAVRLPSIAS